MDLDTFKNKVFSYFLANGKVRKFAKKHINPLLENNVSSLYCSLDDTFLKDHIRNFIGCKKTKPLGLMQCNCKINERNFLAIQIAMGYQLPIKCITVSSYSKCVFDGKVYVTTAYYSDLNRNNTLYSWCQEKLLK
jgi:hypothetical protein